jgi:hypothetical protein
MTEKIVNTAEFERTLKLLAALPAPEGLAGRVQTRLGAPAAAPVRGRLLPWPTERATRTVWLRAAIAAGLLAAVAAGGMTAYRWVAPAPMAHTVPARPAVQQNFSTAGAMRTPLTLNGPVALPAAKSKSARIAQSKSPEPH